ncbi:hypothetical protein [Nonomuraea sp. NPDC050202]|uniref:hypothetical protein n=1 Tax=Nonomuraea sp. NPDC050202 TaxID=3155035 RepID=UPI0033F005F1
MDELLAVHAEIDRGGRLLLLTHDGPGSRAEMIEYVRTVLEQRTTVNDDTTAEKMARAIVTSILYRLSAGWTASAGEAAHASDEQ